MAKIDRLDWADGMSFTSFGVRFAVRVNDSAVLKRVIERLPPGSKPASFKTVDHLYSIISGGEKRDSKLRRLSLAYWNIIRIARAREFEDLLAAFESHLQLTVAEHAPRRIFVHAGVVGWQDRAILVPGRSYSGKTTLVDRLIRAGATYYSDEYAVLDERGRVHPYARPLGIRKAGSTNATRVSAEQIGAQSGLKPLRVGLVVATEYKAEARWRPRSLTPGRGVLELMAHVVAARSQPELALTVLPKAVGSARILKSVRGDAAEVVAAILQSAS
jgi:hypothetical protein